MRERNKMINLISKLVKYFIGFLLFTILFSVLFQIFSRSIFNFSAIWTEDISRLSLVWLCFFGAALLSKENQHMRVTFVLEKFKKTHRIVIEEIIKIVELVFTVIIFIKSFSVLVLSYTQKSILFLPIRYWYIGLILGFCFMAIFLFSNLY